MTKCRFVASCLAMPDLGRMLIYMANRYVLTGPDFIPVEAPEWERLYDVLRADIVIHSCPKQF